MGPEIAAALALAGTGAQMIGARQQQKKQRAILNRSMDETNKTQREASAQVLDEAKKFTPEDRMQSMRDAEQSAFSQAQQDVGGGAAANIPTAAGNVSDAYVKSAADKAISEGNRLTAIAREAAKVRAPGSMQNAEGLRRAQLTGDLGSRWSRTRNMANAAQMDAQSVEAPWYSDLGKIASAVGSAALMAPGAAGAAGVTGANGAFLGEGMASGVGGWDAAMGALPMSASVPWWQRAAATAPRISFRG